jgi:hypothetical protein
MESGTSRVSKTVRGASWFAGTPRHCLVCDFNQRGRVLRCCILCSGFVHAERFFVHVVSRGGVGARAATHADIAEFATAALPFQVVDVAQFVEDHGVLPDVGEGLLLQVTGQRG